VNNAGVSGSAVVNLTGLRVASHHCGQPDPRLAIGAEAPTPVEGPIMLPIADQTLSKSVGAAKKKKERRRAPLTASPLVLSPSTIPRTDQNAGIGRGGLRRFLIVQERDLA